MIRAARTAVTETPTGQRPSSVHLRTRSARLGIALVFATVAPLGVGAQSPTRGRDATALDAAVDAFRSGRFDEVVTLLTPLAVENRTQDVPIDDAERLLAHAHFELGNLAASRLHFERLLHRTPPSLEVLARLAQIETNGERLASALDALRLAALVSPDNRELELWLADAALAANALGEAETRLRHWVQRHPADPELLVRWGEVAERFGNRAEAAARYRTAFHIGRRTPALAERIGRLAVQAGDDPEAAKWFELATELMTAADGDPPPSASTLPYQLALAWYRAGALERALGALEPSLTADRPEPSSALSYRLAGRIAWEQGREDAALEAWERVVGTHAETPEVLSFLANAYYEQERWSEALSCLDRLATLGPAMRSESALRVRCSIRRGDTVATRRGLRDYVAQFGWDGTASSLLVDAIDNQTYTPGE